MGGMATQAQKDLFNYVVRTARGKGVIITTHDIPDVDGLGCAYALRRYIGSRRAVIVTGSTIQRTDPLVDKLGMDLRRWSDIAKDDDRPMVVVDTNTASLMRSANGRGNDILAVIDHHCVTSTPLDATVFIRNERAVSVCEILASLIPSSRIEGDPSIALALAVGIYGDSDRLLIADMPTLHTFEALAGIAGKKRPAIDALAYPPLSADTLVDLLEDIRHLRKETHRGKLIAVGKTTQDVPAVFAMMLGSMSINVGVAVGRIRKGAYRLSFRVNESDAALGLCASEIAEKTSEECGMPKSMYGGGHDNKAGGVIIGSYGRIVAAVMKASKEVIDQTLDKKR
jgi:nanoRNase/pAp phosphatase (c-di-AMP/oligoRNAs hydrolase)